MSSKTQMTDNSNDSPIDQVHAQHGTTSTADLQRKQAEARQLQVAPAETLAPMAPEDVEVLRQMSAEYTDELNSLNGKMHALQGKIAETVALINDINSRIAQAEYKPLAELNKDYFAQQKASLEARFEQNRRIKEALASVGVDGTFDYNKLGNGPSPLDQAISARNQSRRQTVRPSRH